MSPARRSQRRPTQCRLRRPALTHQARAGATPLRPRMIGCALIALVGWILVPRAWANELTPGLSYKNERIRSVPWSIHVLQIDRSRSDLQFLPTMGKHTTMGLSTLSEQVRRIPAEWGQPLAAINGDFYHLENDLYPGDPIGALILNEEIVSPPDGKACFWIDGKNNPHAGIVAPRFKVVWPSGDTMPIGLNEERRSNGAVLFTPRIGFSTRTSGGYELILERIEQDPWLPFLIGGTYRARVKDVREGGNTRLKPDIAVLSVGNSLAARLPKIERGAELKLMIGTSPDLSGVKIALGGGPVLIHKGEPQDSVDHKSYQRHPRAAIGWNAKYFYLVAIDGRQPGLSMGMTLEEVSNYLLKLGCEEAMNLDGGGSVELWVEGRIVNSPCFGQERHTGSSLVLLQSTRKSSP